MAINYQLQDKFLTQFFSLPFADRFYLTGGTALARFYFHHRESFDLDLFTNEESVDFNQVNMAIINLLNEVQVIIDTQVTTPTFLQYITHTKRGATLKIDVVKDVPVHFGSIQTKERVRIDSIENIGSNKILAIFGRTDAKDYVDLFWILNNTPLTIDQLFTHATKKDLGLTEFYLSQAFDHARTLTQFPVLLKPLDIPKMMAFYQTLSRDLLTRIKPKT